MIIYLIIFLAVISRFVPHIPNFAPITALGIFVAYHLSWKKAAGLVLITRLISDIFIGFVSWPMMLAIYASHLAGVLFGTWIKTSTYVIPESRVRPRDIRNPGHLILDPGAEAGMTRHKWFKIIFSSLGASAIFFLVTNFAFLYSSYPHNWEGIIQAYINGLPFLRGTLFGDMFYSVALFGAYGLVKFFISKKFNHQYSIRQPADLNLK